MVGRCAAGYSADNGTANRQGAKNAKDDDGSIE